MNFPLVAVIIAYLSDAFAFMCAIQSFEGAFLRLFFHPNVFI